GQQALTIARDNDGYAAIACAQSPCGAGAPTALAAVPARFRQGVPVFRDVTLEQGRTGVIAVLTESESQQRWVTVVAAPTAAGAPPKLLFNGLGDPDARGSASEPHTVQVVPHGSASRIVISPRGGASSFCAR